MQRVRYTTASKTVITSLFVLALGLLGGCSSGSSDSPAGNTEAEAPLSDLGSLVDGVPSNDQLPPEGKADAVYPKQFFDLVSKQSPVHSQGRRGVCSIFATVALMEHLYISEGSLTKPDFSEQFLQWSVKAENKSYTSVEGSNANNNLETINRFGIVEESAWPYESSPWSSSNDPACTGGEKLPTRCYTNGEPPESAKASQRYYLPRGRWVNSTANSIKAFMTGKHQGVIAGGPFYYQAWNHGASSLPVNRDYWRKGYVLFPNAQDQEASEKKPAGHAILLVGWDDELTVQALDGQGKPMVDAEGKPVMEKGFFLFKNSWGTGSFGVENPQGDGYGWLSMRYVEKYLSVYGSDLPQVKPAKEVCNDKLDNDRDSKVDCQDSDCASDPACKTGATNSYANAQAQAIPDNSPAGIESTIEVPEGGTISALSVSVDITHSYRGDLVVKLVRGAKEVLLHNKEGASDDNLSKTYAVSDFNGLDAAGSWKLVVIDTASSDTGTLNRWSLDITRCQGASCPAPAPSYENNESKAIPDNDPIGVFTNIQVSPGRTIRDLKVNVMIEHPAANQLTLKLLRVGQPGEVVLQSSSSSSQGEFDIRTFSVSSFNTQDSAGTWRLVVIDEQAGQSGTLLGWSLQIQ